MEEFNIQTPLTKSLIIYLFILYLHLLNCVIIDKRLFAILPIMIYYIVYN